MVGRTSDGSAANLALGGPVEQLTWLDIPMAEIRKMSPTIAGAFVLVGDGSTIVASAIQWGTDRNPHAWDVRYAFTDKVDMVVAGSRLEALSSTHRLVMDRLMSQGTVGDRHNHRWGSWLGVLAAHGVAVEVP